MGILLAFAPFIAFAIVAWLAGGLAGLFAGTAVSAILLGRDWLRRTGSVKVLELGTFILFAGLAAFAYLAAAEWSIVGVRLRVDAGLLLIVLVSIAIRQPFTLQYARERVAPELWQAPEFIRVNYAITTAWAAAFVAMVLADLLMLYVPGVPKSVGILVTVAALYAAIKFTAWYPERKRAPTAG